ncbi:hypothetical protein Maq22A_c27965 [Methylobacterium aquaticum]|uniref:Uncharacterized protein n=1 Tax=Methylobacterium aquaticum TaxID=270351 RepID=A0A1Y0Z8L1_9HYPH|nr:hypothetical protein Maq22A_c27965 [Methylobacterium aquaticum]
MKCGSKTSTVGLRMADCSAPASACEWLLCTVRPRAMRKAPVTDRRSHNCSTGATAARDIRALIPPGLAKSLGRPDQPRLERVRHVEVFPGWPPCHPLAGALVQLSGDDVEGLGVGGRVSHRPVPASSCRAAHLRPATAPQAQASTRAEVRTR